MSGGDSPNTAQRTNNLVFRRLCLDLGVRRILPLSESLFRSSFSPPSQLTASDINFAIIRPLVFKYAALKNLAVVYACLVVRAHFIALAAADIAHASLMTSRADMCELMAMKLLRDFASSKVELAAVLTTSWSPIAGAPPEVVEEVRDSLGGKDENLDDPTSALEVSVVSEYPQK